ncbi:MAG: GDP-mannose 4,6-dehydratase, partial [Gaiellaceae bacterium]
PGEIYNIGGGHEVENVEVVKLILELTGAPESLVQRVPDRPGHDRRYSLDCGKAKSELGWEPQVAFQNGLAETVAWYRDNRAWWEPIKSGEHYQAYYERQYAARLAAGEPVG